ARRNRVAKRMRLRRADLTKLPERSTHQYDLICANLISTLLLAERRRMLARLKPCGLLVLAGILDAEFSQVRRTFESAGLRLVASRAHKEWRSGPFAWKRNHSNAENV